MPVDAYHAAVYNLFENAHFPGKVVVSDNNFVAASPAVAVLFLILGFLLKEVTSREVSLVNLAPWYMNMKKNF